MQVMQGCLPLISTNKVIPVWNLIVHGTPGLTKWRAAVHTTRALLAACANSESASVLVPVAHALRRRLLFQSAARNEFEGKGSFLRIHA